MYKNLYSIYTALYSKLKPLFLEVGGANSPLLITNNMHVAFGSEA